MTSYDVYVVTDESLSNGRSHAEIAKQSFEGGADVVQLRYKGEDKMECLRIAREIAEISKSYDGLFIVNDYLDVALASGADGVHLGQSDTSVSEARKMATKGFVIGASVSNVGEATVAAGSGADYVAVSPLFDTPSKPDAGPAVGMETLKDICMSVEIPVIAIGGINSTNTMGIIEAGAAGIAVISAVVSQSDIPDSVRKLKAIVKMARSKASSTRL